MDFLPLSLIFLSTGLLAIIYYRFVPSADRLRERLPNKPSVASVFLAIVIGVLIWYVLSYYDGFSVYVRIYTLLFALLFFESLFLLLMRWIKSNLVAVLASLGATAGIFWLQISEPTFLLLNSIIIVATLGAATLLIRLGYLRTKILFVVTILWTIYDIMLVQFLLPTVTRETTMPRPSFILPAVSVGEISLGSGDFMFLTLFALMMYRNFGALAALVLVAAEGVGLMITGLLLPEQGFLVPFLVVMMPIFFGVYWVAWLAKKRAA